MHVEIDLFYFEIVIDEGIQKVWDMQFVCSANFWFPFVIEHQVIHMFAGRGMQKHENLSII